MTEKEKGKDKGFVVIDRRGADDEAETTTQAAEGGAQRAEGERSSHQMGSAQPASESAQRAEGERSSHQTESARSSHQTGGERSPHPGELPRIDFSTFVLSLSTSALYHLGLVEDPETHRSGEIDLPLARQTIDTLELLQEKTRGNLEEQEAQLLEHLLYELRMRFVEASRPNP